MGLSNRSRSKEKVQVVEVAARDGLQSEIQVLSVEQRVKFINYLSEINYSAIEVGSFVSSIKLPQMASSDLVYSKIKKNKDIDYSILVPNQFGLQQALKNNVQHIAVFASVCEEFSQKNINCSIQQSMNNYKNIIQQAGEKGIKARGYLSCVFGSSFTKKTNVKKVVELAQKLMDYGCVELSLSDTLGHASPLIVRNLLKVIIKEIPIKKVALHFHDTYGQALVNCYAALEIGFRKFDSALGGLGGCPLAKGAGGNLATEDLVYLLNGLDIDCGIRLDELTKARNYLRKYITHPLASKVAKAIDKKSGEHMNG